MFDKKDLKILKIIQKNGRTTNAAIARRVGLAPSAVFGRLRRLEREGVVQGYAARLSPRALGLGLVAFVFVRGKERAGGVRTAVRLARIPEVLETHHVAGEDCLLLKVRAADTEALGRVLRRRLGAISSIRSTRTTIVLETMKETGALPLPKEPPRGSKVRRG